MYSAKNKYEDEENAPLFSVDEQLPLSNERQSALRELNRKLVGFLCSLGVLAIVQGVLAVVWGPHFVGLVVSLLLGLFVFSTVVGHIKFNCVFHKTLKLVWHIFFGVIALFSILFLVISLLNTGSAPELEIFPEQCPKTTNCVRFALTGVNNNALGYKFPFINESLDFIKTKINEWRVSTAPSHVVSSTNQNLLHFVFISTFFGFADDFFVDVVSVDGVYAINTQSQSRLGSDDLGVNKKRTDKFFAFLEPYLFVYSEISSQVNGDMDWTTPPCEDFYQFSCGNWLLKTELPPSFAIFSRSFNVISERNEQTLLSIVNNSANTQLYQFFTACMDLADIESHGYLPLNQDLLIIAGLLPNASNLMDIIGQLMLRGVNPFFSFSAQVDEGNPSHIIAVLNQGGLGLPDASLYTQNASNSETLIQYKAHVLRLFQLINLTTEDPYLDAVNAVNIETTIASFTTLPDKLQNPFRNYNKMTVAQLEEMTPNIKWTPFLERLGLSGYLNVTVVVPSFFVNLSSSLPGFQNGVEAYLKLQVLHTRANLLSSAFTQEMFHFFQTILRGIKEMDPRWKYCVQVTDSSLGELLGKYYMEQAFSPKSNDYAENLINSIIASMKVDIEHLKWMTNTTSSKALEKLAMVTHLIGGPENPKNYSNVQLGPHFFNNVIGVSIDEIQRLLATIGGPVNKKEWEMTSPTVNAYYDPTRNQMVFPAGILQKPFFDGSYPQAMNTGGIGMVMGHELTHAFDSQGRLYTGSGLLQNWWDNVTDTEFDTKGQCVVTQYSKFEPLPGVFINGELTLGENIADMGGIKQAYNTLSTQIASMDVPSIVPGLSQAQLFFVSFAQTWCSKATDQYVQLMVKTNPHSPPLFRVIGSLINFPKFSEIFKCSVGSRMNPGERCEVL